MAGFTLIEDHNGPRWLAVRRLDTARGPGFYPGWYVVRTCPCHQNHVVTLPYPDAARADRVRRLLLGEISGPSGVRIRWPQKRARPAPAAGQIWRRAGGIKRNTTGRERTVASWSKASPATATDAGSKSDAARGLQPSALPTAPGIRLSRTAHRERAAAR